jgi:hypothetical protein
MTDLLVADIFDEMLDPDTAKYARLIGFMAALAIFVATGFYLISRFRNQYRESDVGSGILLDNFRELHSGGQLSDEEYRNIKSKLAARLREEIQQSDQAK